MYRLPSSGIKSAKGWLLPHPRKNTKRLFSMLQIREPFTMSYGCFFKVGSPKIPLVSCHFRIETAIKRWRVPCQTNHDSMPWLRHGLSYGQSVPSMQRVFVSLRLLLGRLKPIAFSSYSLYFCATMSMSMSNVLKIHCKVWHCPDGQPWEIHPSSCLISILNQPQRA